MTSQAKIDDSLSHIWHVWINKYQETVTASGEDRWHSLYEFKSMLDFLRYGHHVIRNAFEGKLPKIHRQCSHTFSVPILNNVLMCALGKDVTSCPILLSLKETFDAEKARIYPFNGEQAYPHVPSDALYVLMTKTCAWHILREATSMKEGFRIDTSEGYVMDTSDRMFWSNVYESLSQSDEDCCAKTGHFCPFCIATLALSVVNPSPVEVREPQKFEDWWNQNFLYFAESPAEAQHKRPAAEAAWNAAMAAKSDLAPTGKTWKEHAAEWEVSWENAVGYNRESLVIRNALQKERDGLRENVTGLEAENATLRAKSGTGDGVGWIDVKQELPPENKNHCWLAWIKSENKAGGYIDLVSYGDYICENDDIRPGDPLYIEDSDDGNMRGRGWYREEETHGGSYDYVFVNLNGKVAYWMPMPAAPVPKPDLLSLTPEGK